MEILYLEDSEPDIKLMQQYLRGTNYQFTTVRTLEDAQAYLHQNHPDIFLVDIVIGKDTAHKLIQFAIQQARTKHVVAVTAKVLPSEQKQYYDLGCSSILPKPFTVDDLEHVLSKLAG